MHSYWVNDDGRHELHGDQDQLRIDVFVRTAEAEFDFCQLFSMAKHDPTKKKGMIVAQCGFRGLDLPGMKFDGLNMSCKPLAFECDLQ